jgi:hypothetical protein
VVRAEPFQSALEFAVKPVPVRVTVLAKPAAALTGVMAVSVGTGVAIDRLAGAESAAMGAGLWTVTLAVRALANVDAVTAACREVALTKVVTREVPSSTTVEPETKLLPVTVSCVIAEPAAIVEGESEVIDGGG